MPSNMNHVNISVTLYVLDTIARDKQNTFCAEALALQRELSQPLNKIVDTMYPVVMNPVTPFERYLAQRVKHYA